MSCERLARNLPLLVLLLAGCQAGAGSGLTATLLLALAAGWLGCRPTTKARSTAGNPPVADAGPIDARSDQILPDASVEMGAWVRCCRDGRIATCFCPPLVACNYSRDMSSCPDGTCGPVGTVSCPSTDALTDLGTDGGTDAGTDAGLGRDAPD